MHELIERSVVHAPDKSSGHSVQQVDIYYRFNIAVSTAIADRRDYDKKKKAAQLQPFSKIISLTLLAFSQQPFCILLRLSVYNCCCDIQIKCNYQPDKVRYVHITRGWAYPFKAYRHCGNKYDKQQDNRRRKPYHFKAKENNAPGKVNDKLYNV